MKKLSLILLFVSFSIYSQKPTDSLYDFTIENNEIVFKKVYEINGTKSEIEQKLRNFFKEKFGSEGLAFFLEKSGQTCDKTVVQLRRSTIDYQVIAQVKDGKYRVTIRPKTIHSPNTYLGDMDFTEFFSKKHRTKFRKGKVILNSMRCLNNYFTNQFDINQYTATDW